MFNILIKNVTIITMNEKSEIIENGVVVIKDGEIIDIGNSELEDIYDKFYIIDGNNGILMPGMINCHSHVSMVAFRSLADDAPDRLKKYIFPLEKNVVDKELVYIGARYGICEMLLSGVTTFCDMYYYESEVAKAAKRLGIRGVLGETIVDFPSPDSKEPFGGLKYCEEFIKKWQGDELITPAIAPHAPYTNDDLHLIKAYKLSKKYNIPLTMHVAEMDYEYKKYKNEYNMSPVQYLDSLKILDKNFIGAHMVLVDDKDIDILEKRQIGVSHNIGANSKGAKGVAPILKMCEKKISIGLGTDGPMSGNTLDIITQMSLVGKIQKLFNKDRRVFPAKDIVKMATIGGAKVLNLDHLVGSIQIGKKADLVILETESINMNPIYDYYSTIVYSANPSNVDTVIVNGNIIVRNKRILHVDFNDIFRSLIKMKEKILVAIKEL
ncbi:amidohydrolase [Clostridium rectalis]|uniref:amidohydrolase n=1 Tax=Clostridium rectalis TaxID=2040295 RepID=UPI000F6410BF|nr:amidohydrolase [Clostridium rectalis]